MVSQKVCQESPNNLPKPFYQGLPLLDRSSEFLTPGSALWCLQGFAVAVWQTVGRGVSKNRWWYMTNTYTPPPQNSASHSDESSNRLIDPELQMSCRLQPANV